MSKFYYSAEKKETKIKIFRMVLCVLLAVLVIIGGVYTIVYVHSLENQNTIDSPKAAEQVLDVNVLVCVEDEDNEDIPPQILLVRFDSVKKSIFVSEIPTNLTILSDGKPNTVLKHFKYGSARYLRDAIVSHFGIDVKRYIRCSLSEVETFVDKLGGVDFEISKQMQFKNKEGNLVTNLVKGKQKLNGNQYCQYLRYGNWSSEAQKCEKRADLLVALLNEHSKSLESDRILAIYKSVSNNLETDASIVEVNDFSLQFSAFSSEEAPAKRIDIDFSDSDTASAQISKFYK